jgi:RNA polymerase-binding transcription factor DksA
MSEAKEIRDRLERQLARLLARAGKIEANLRQPGHRDSEEQAAQRQNDEVLEHLDAAEHAEVGELRAALARLDTGSYGECQRCGEKISSGRLAALPATSTCVECAEDTRVA